MTASAVEMARERPWTGFGKGTFEFAYPADALFDPGTLVNHAHNDWAEWAADVKRFEALNPYDRDAVPGSVLKIEGDNRDPKTGKQRQIYCYAISAKRYALFVKDADGRPVLLREGTNNAENHWSEHGLGHLLNPTDPESDDREWAGQVWQNILLRQMEPLPRIRFVRGNQVEPLRICSGRMPESTLVRVACVARIYGGWFAFGVPLRMFWANWVNFLATAAAIKRYITAKMKREPLVWLKTEHLYPTRAALAKHKRPFEEVLVGSNYVTAEQLAGAMRTKPGWARVGEHLVTLGYLTCDQLYEALSLQQNVPFEKIDPAGVPLRVARALPGAVSRMFKLLPVRIAAGRMYLAGPELPADTTMKALRNYTRLDVEFQFTTPENFDELVAQLLGRRAAAA